MSETITKYNPGDEVQGTGHFHLERMSRGHVWLMLGGFAFDLRSEHGGLSLAPQQEVEVGTHNRRHELARLRRLERAALRERQALYVWAPLQAEYMKKAIRAGVGPDLSRRYKEARTELRLAREALDMLLDPEYAAAVEGDQ